MKKRMAFSIGISLGTRSIGVALFDSHKLKNYKVLVFRRPWCRSKKIAIIEKLNTLLPNRSCMVGIKVPHRTYRSRQLQELLEAMLEHLKGKNIPTKLYSLQDLKEHCFPSQRVNKRALIHCIGTKYRQLFMKYQRESRNRHVHYTKLFEATIAAEIVTTENAH